MLLNLLLFKLPTLSQVVFRVAMRHKKAVIGMLIQIVNAFHHEVVVVSSAFDDLGIEDMRHKCQKMIVISASGQNRHPMQIFLDCLLKEALRFTVVQNILLQLNVFDELNCLLLFNLILFV